MDIEVEPEIGDGANGRGGIALLLVIAIASACTADAPGPRPPTIARQDVTNLPAGNADVHPNFTGFYRSVSDAVTGCFCRAGNCSMFRGEVGVGLTVDLVGGKVDAIVDDGTEMKGGVNQDGIFWCGGFRDAIGDAGNIKVTGTFTPPTSPKAIDLTSNRTVMGISHAGTFDCDVAGTAHFEAPPP